MKDKNACLIKTTLMGTIFWECSMNSIENPKWYWVMFCIFVLKKIGE
jgi:hypothetical protein